MATKEQTVSQTTQYLTACKESQAQAMDATIKNVARGIINLWPEEAAIKTLHQILVTFNGEAPRREYTEALAVYCQRQQAWLATQGIRALKWSVETAIVPGKPEDYGFVSLVRKLMDLGAMSWNGKNAYYLWMQSPGIVIGGTLGGDVFGQKGGKHGNREPGVSAFDVDGIHALAFGRPLNTLRTLTTDMAMGAAAHEIGHEFLLPCAKSVSGAPHGQDCIMEHWWLWPACKYERQGYIWDDRGPQHWQAGEEVKYLLDSGFFVEV